MTQVSPWAAILILMLCCALVHIVGVMFRDNARLRAALEEIEEMADSDDEWCHLCSGGAIVGAGFNHSDQCPVTVAHNALHPEEGER